MVNLSSLIGRLNAHTRNALEGAAGLCLSRTHYDVEIEHFLVKAMDATDGDLAAILAHFGVNRARLSADLSRALDKLKSGNARTPSISPTLTKALTEGWLIGSVDFDAVRIRTGHVMIALVTNDELHRLVRETTRELEKVSAEALQNDFETIVAKSGEEAMAGMDSAGGGAQPEQGRGAGHLDKYTNNLTERAQKNLIDPVLGRDFEVRQVVDILTRRRQNNPILVGEAGVGKTAVVEGLAVRIVQGDVPPPLKGVTLRTLDLALLQAGAGVKGEFENRLRGLIDEVKSSPTPIILFIDEAHTIIGAGGAPGQGDAANLLKPALARGELRTIAATTWSEYKKYFEKDPALARRFQLIKVDEPSEDACLVMMRGVVPALEHHHKVRILDEGADAAVRLTHRFLPERQLPDKAVSVLDTACARVALSHHAMPAALEDTTRELDDIEVQTRVLERERMTGSDHGERITALAERKVAAEKRRVELTARWERERDLVMKVRAARETLEAGAGTETTDNHADGDRQRVELATLTETLRELQGDTPLVPVVVDANLVGQVISSWTGIPAGKMLRDDINVALHLEQHLEARIIGQAHALEAISRRIRTSKASIEDPNKPVGVFLLVGPSGVGKTETALTLSDMFYGGERNLITINMSEFQESHTVSTLKGSPPGYVGYGEGGVLTEAVRRRPYSVVLLDEIEKAHPDVLELFYQVFDKGVMEDGEGRQIDFKNNIIILTTNAGTETIMKLCADPETMPGHEGLVRALKPELDKTFKPAFLGRTVIIPYFPIRDEALKQIIRLKLGKVERRLLEAQKVRLTYDETVVNAIALRCTEVESGARNVDNILTNTLLPEISTLLLQSLADGNRPATVRVAVGESGAFDYIRA